MANSPRELNRKISISRVRGEKPVLCLMVFVALTLSSVLSSVAWAQMNPMSIFSGSCRIGEIRKSFSTIPTVVRFERLFLSFDWQGEALVQSSIRMFNDENQVIESPVRIHVRTVSGPFGQYRRELTATVFNRFTNQMETVQITSSDDFEFTWHSPNAGQAQLGDTVAVWLYCFMNSQSDTAGVDLDDLIRRVPSGATGSTYPAP